MLSRVIKYMNFALQDDDNAAVLPAFASRLATSPNLFSCVMV